MAIYRHEAGVSHEVTRIRHQDGATLREVQHVYDGQRHDPVWSHAQGPVLTGFGASQGSGTFPVLTLNRTQLPISPTVRGALAAQAGTTLTGWTLYRYTHDGTRQEAALGGPGVTQVHFQENLTSQFRPPASGWRYELVATDSDGGETHASCTIRVVTAPTVANLRATAPVFLGNSNTQVVYLNWDATGGDPPATWQMAQGVGDSAQLTLPTGQRLSPAQGRATGLQRTRVARVGHGGVSHLHLEGINDATLPVNRGPGRIQSNTLTINWSS